jgi:hypothetical protein
MDICHYRGLFNSQKGTAKARGIDFLLTFQEWCNFWGEDIDRRGSGPDSLQMQRNLDTGPYALGNIKKGTPKQNSATYQNMRLNRQTEQAGVDLQIELDALMNEPAMPEYDWNMQEQEIYRRRMRTSYERRYDFAKG